MKRKLTWSELPQALKQRALRKLSDIALAKARYDGTVLPYAWPERIAPRLVFTRAGSEIWDCNPTAEDRRRGFTLFTLPLPMEVSR